ncbi:MAG: protease complex subunit PrcB family protein [Lachnospiraceae bacterium]|nr:protease complex subunit PrcB family protein [Lachnospiraceae bacterium]
MKRGYAVMLLFLTMIILSGCKGKEQGEEKVRDLSFAVLCEETIPQECRERIEEKKKDPFQFTYADGQYLYICVGYGRQEFGGYSISVNDLYLTGHAICVDTDLTGPAADDEKIRAETYPVVVIKTEYLDKNVVFQ